MPIILILPQNNQGYLHENQIFSLSVWKIIKVHKLVYTGINKIIGTHETLHSKDITSENMFSSKRGRFLQFDASKFTTQNRKKRKFYDFG